MEIFTNKNIVARSKTGLRHQLKNEKGQDSFCCFQDDEFIFACVSDGVSSAKYSRLGAMLVTFEAIRFLRLYAEKSIFFDEKKRNLFIKELIISLKERIKRSAELHGYNVQEYASTVLLCIRYQDHFISVQLGDGAIVISADKFKLHRLPTNTPDKLRKNLTYSTYDLFTENWEKLVTVTTGDCKSLFMFTDGVSPLYQQLENLGDFCIANAFYSSADRLSIVEELMKACANITLDDNTIVAINNARSSIYDLTLEQRMRLFGVEKKFRVNEKRKIRRIIRVYRLLEEPITSESVAKKLNISLYSAERRLKKLMNVGLAERMDNHYIKSNQT